jgi:hypothetical protein
MSTVNIHENSKVVLILCYVAGNILPQSDGFTVMDGT